VLKIKYKGSLIKVTFDLDKLLSEEKLTQESKGGRCREYCSHYLRLEKWMGDNLTHSFVENLKAISCA